jgi:hypothetical protein
MGLSKYLVSVYWERYCSRSPISHQQIGFRFFRFTLLSGLRGSRFFPIHNRRAVCWRSLMLIINHQLLHEIAWNKPQSIVVGFDYNEFHELCCSHLFCRIFNILLHKSISSKESEYTITKSSSRQSKQIYQLLYLEFQRESPRWIRLGRFYKTPEPSPTKSFRD